MTASAFSLSSLYGADQFEVTAGETVRGGLKSGPNHHFCGSCQSWLFTVPEGLEDFVNVRSTLLDDAAEHRPFVEMWIREGFDWARTGAHHSYATAPESSEFGELIAAYGAWDGKVKQ